MVQPNLIKHVHLGEEGIKGQGEKGREDLKVRRGSSSEINKYINPLIFLIQFIGLLGFIVLDRP